jgi:hypothetical protein
MPCRTRWAPPAEGLLGADTEPVAAGLLVASAPPPLLAVKGAAAEEAAGGAPAGAATAEVLAMPGFIWA